MHVVDVKMCGFETVNGDSVGTTIDVDGEVFVSSFDDWVRSVIWWLKWFADSIVPDTNMCGR